MARIKITASAEMDNVKEAKTPTTTISPPSSCNDLLTEDDFTLNTGIPNISKNSNRYGKGMLEVNKQLASIYIQLPLGSSFDFNIKYITNLRSIGSNYFPGSGSVRKHNKHPEELCVWVKNINITPEQLEEIQARLD